MIHGLLRRRYVIQRKLSEYFKPNPLLLIAIALLVLGSGCAGVKGHAILTDDDDARDLGFRYYESSPYLLVHTDNEGGLKSEIIHLPDETKKRSVRPYNYAANISTTFEFKNGVLTHGVADIDETVIPKAIISALETAAKAMITAANTTKPSGPSVPAPYLFKLVIRTDAVELIGGQPGQHARISFGNNL